MMSGRRASMSEKKKDDKNRWRNKTIAFRGSPEEAVELDKRWKLCGYATKQDNTKSLDDKAGGRY